MTQRAIIENYAQAIQIVKEINHEYPEWEDGDWKEEGRKAVKRIIEERGKFPPAPPKKSNKKITQITKLPNDVSALTSS